MSGEGHGRGRPLRFLALVGVGWVALRVAMLWPQTGSLPRAIEAAIPLAAAEPVPVPVPAPAPERRPVHPAAAIARRPVRLGSHRASPAPGFAPAIATAIPRSDPFRVQLALLALLQYGPAEAWSPNRIAMWLPSAAIPERLAPLPDRWSASAWLVARPGAGLGAAPGASQLGGSQAGVRVAYMLAPEARLAAFARVATPLRGKGREAALGLEWQPGRAPVRLVAEQRFGLDGTPGGTGLGAVAGIDTRVPAGFRLEAYGQAGAVHRTRIEPYADGAARTTRTVHDAGAWKVSLGAGAWGAAQREAARLDLGPTATAWLPVAGKTVRVSLDWRQRVAGGARPGSGLALTLGSDF